MDSRTDPGGVQPGSDKPIIDDGPTTIDTAPKAVKEDDKYPAVHGDAEMHDPPLRSPRPDVAIAQRLADGAGQHVPLVDENFNDEGRFIGRVEGAYGKPGERGALSKADQDKAAKDL